MATIDTCRGRAEFLGFLLVAAVALPAVAAEPPSAERLARLDAAMQAEYTTADADSRRALRPSPIKRPSTDGPRFP